MKSEQKQIYENLKNNLFTHWNNTITRETQQIRKEEWYWQLIRLNLMCELIVHTEIFKNENWCKTKQNTRRAKFQNTQGSDKWQKLNEIRLQSS